MVVAFVDDDVVTVELEVRQGFPDVFARLPAAGAATARGDPLGFLQTVLVGDDRFGDGFRAGPHGPAVPVDEDTDESDRHASVVVGPVAGEHADAAYPQVLGLEIFQGGVLGRGCCSTRCCACVFPQATAAPSPVR